jgi:hypothetical protein
VSFVDFRNDHHKSKMLKSITIGLILTVFGSSSVSASPKLISQDLLPLNPANIVAVGAKAWDVISNNQATGNLSAYSASALPKGLDDWQQITGWQSNSSDVFQYAVKDPLGIGMVTYKYRLIYNYGGKFASNGVSGSYISDLRVQPDSVWVNVGNHFDTTVTISDNVLNVGSATQPIAAMTLIHRMHFHNWNRDTTQEDTYVVRADGLYKKL